MKKIDEKKWLTAAELAKAQANRGPDYKAKKETMKAAVKASNESLRQRLQGARRTKP